MVRSVPFASTAKEEEGGKVAPLGPARDDAEAGRLAWRERSADDAGGPGVPRARLPAAGPGEPSHQWPRWRGGGSRKRPTSDVSRRRIPSTTHADNHNGSSHRTASNLAPPPSRPGSRPPSHPRFRTTAPRDVPPRRPRSLLRRLCALARFRLPPPRLRPPPPRLGCPARFTWQVEEGGPARQRRTPFLESPGVERNLGRRRGGGLLVS